MKLEQLQHIIEIDKQKSIGKAAKSLYIAQSTLSGSLASLEEELGVQLFRRTANGAVPTQEGKKALQLARVTMDSVEQILNIGKQETELYGSVTVYIGQGYSFLAADLLREFHKKHPKAELDLQIVTPDQQMEHLISTENIIALAVVMDPTIELLKRKRPNLSYERFGHCKFQIYVGQDNHLSEREIISWQELRKENFLTNSLPLRQMIWQTLGSEKNVLAISDKETLNQLISTGEWVAFLPELFIQKNFYCANGMIKALDVENCPLGTSAAMMLIYPEERALTLLEQSTIQIVRDVMQKI